MIAQIVSEAFSMRSSLLKDGIDRFLLEERRLRCVTINTHRGRGPNLSLLRQNSRQHELERIELMHDTRAYTYFIADWLNGRKECFDVVALQEVFSGILGIGERIAQKYRQRDHYRVLSGFESCLEHGVGFAGFRYQNLMLSQLPKLSRDAYNHYLPGKVFFLASCGFTLAPFLLKDTIIWIGNTHLHAYNPSVRMKQARSVARAIKALGDVPVVFLGDFNSVPEGFTSTNYAFGDIDRYSYRNDNTLRILQDVGLMMTHHEDTATYYTYPTGAPNRTLDYILFSRHWHVHDYRVLHDFTLSDHYPVYAELELIHREN
jgi:endonuclease/exonuclease/phosphatase family metal-dependent hydrolase